MKITDIRIRRIYEESRLRALVSLTLGDDFAIHDIKVIDGPERLFVAMPSRRDEQGNFRDICHPITSEARRELEDKILKEYYTHISTLDNKVHAPESAAEN
ncbi:MAG: septation regulator SpoVG [Candidatus Fimivivens sp.]